MKCPVKIIAVAACTMLAIAGCRYDDAVEQDSSNTADVVDVNTDDNATGQDIASDKDIAEIKDDEGVPVTGVPFDQIYKRCTDVNFEPVYFGFDASTLPSAEMAKIETVAAHLMQKTDRVVIVEGHCDDRGSNEYNLSLGQLRAIAIRDYLVQLGIAADRIQEKSYGEEKPVDPAQNDAAWAKNRRGEFAIFQK